MSTTHKLYEKHKEGVKGFLASISAGSKRTTDSDVPANIRNVCKARGLATVSGVGRGAEWTITPAGKSALAGM